MRIKRRIFRKILGDIGLNNLADRQSWVKEALSKLPNGYSIIDVGAGEMQYKQYCMHLNYVSQDFGEYEGEGNKEGLQTGTWDTSKIDIVSDILEIPEPDASFDAILCTEVLEHIPEPITALIELHRLLKPGGELILTAPFASLTHFAPYHYYSGFNKYFYEHHLSKIGFSIIEISANGDYSAYVAQELIRIMKYYGKAPLYLKLCIAMILRFIKTKHKHKNILDLGCFGFHIIAIKNTE